MFPNSGDFLLHSILRRKAKMAQAKTECGASASHFAQQHSMGAHDRSGQTAPHADAALQLHHVLAQLGLRPSTCQR
jgi:hypothetical protein